MLVFLRSSICATAASLGSLSEVAGVVVAAAEALAVVRSLLEGRTRLDEDGRPFKAEP